MVKLVPLPNLFLGPSVTDLILASTNISAVLVTLDISNPDISKFCKFGILANISDISVTLEVSKLETSNVSKVSLLNIQFMLVTCDVLKLDRLTLFKPVQLANILSMRVTFDVSKLDKSKLVSLEQKSNMYAMFVVFEVSIFDKSAVVKFLKYVLEVITVAPNSLELFSGAMTGLFALDVSILVTRLISISIDSRLPNLPPMRYKVPSFVKYQFTVPQVPWLTTSS